jgi:hypothetical protein
MIKMHLLFCYAILFSVVPSPILFTEKPLFQQDDSKTYISLKDGTNVNSVCHAGRTKNLYNSHASKKIEVVFSVSDFPNPITAYLSPKENKFIGCASGADNKPVTYKIISTKYTE